ncbi:SDR family oxidoreductase [Komagataeibacter oboediens]|uniref:SDR family oxidoreductase n=1 Tax=Komagataeibacter oboediens TaxID=65958 RepID=UPI001C2C218C|nr:SDR family oxidoreductase [Komagataeibacter oboediens]MBV0888769.1 SDR family oxidoreductase [Komagataeibacter oboediens]MCK9821294.1 SDR family oxidoreductase [Komagataeibacter oboediens]
MNRTVLITGAGSGFGREIALRLAARQWAVIAGVQIPSQIFALHAEAERRGVHLQVEKLDVTNAADRDRFNEVDVDVLLNNAGIGEGGSMVDIPEATLRRQFEVNVTGPVMLTQAIARRMVARRAGKIVFMSSCAGLTSDPFTGAYSASKHAIEAIAEALGKELQEFSVAVATINPGPFLTGFNDRIFDSWKNWPTERKDTLFDYERIAYPYKQFDIEPVVETTIGVIEGTIDSYRNVEPKQNAAMQRQQMDAAWTRKSSENLGRRFAMVQTAYDMQPATPADE